MNTLNEKKIWSWSSFFLGLLVAALCLFIVNEAKKEVMTFEASSLEAQAATSSDGNRSPASIKRSFDFSELEGSALEQAAKKRLLKSIKIENEANTSLIQLGNFVLLNTQKEKEFACGVYNHITFNFEADGVAVDGGKPVLIIDSPCDVAGNINELSPIKIPYQKIRSGKPSLASTMVLNNDNSLKVQTKNSPEVWPKTWVLTEITLSRSGSHLQNLHISHDEIADLINKPVIMNW